MKKVFLEDLPRRGSYMIDWRNSVGCNVGFVYDDMHGTMEIVEYKDRHVTLKYNDKILNPISTASLANASIGVLIGKLSKGGLKNEQFFIDQVAKLEPTYSVVGKYCGVEAKIEMMCDKGHIFNITPSSFLRGSRCGVCYGSQVVKGVNDVGTTHPHLVEYFFNIEDAYSVTCGNSKKIKFKCPRCGHVKYMATNTLNHYGFRCNVCGDGISYPNKFMCNLLKELNIDFIPEYSPEWIKPKRYDFYIPSKNLIIEMDGGFHYRDNNMKGVTCEDAKLIDEYKDTKAYERCIKVIRIPCDYGNHINKRNEIITNNVLSNKDIREAFDIESINWEKIQLLSERNLVYDVCKYWSNSSKNINDISNHFKISKHTIRNYLKIGNKIGICDYLPNTYLSIGRKTEVFKDGISLGVFKSAGEIARISNTLFGINLTQSKISLVCNYKKPQYKGFVFRYVD